MRKNLERWYLKSKRYILGVYMKRHALHLRYFSFFLISLFAMSMVIFNLLAAPSDFPVGTLVSIDRGMSLRDATELLKERGVVRSSVLTSAVVKLIAGEKGVLSGQYFFEMPETTLGVAFRIVRGNYGLDPVKITIPEGATTYEIAEVLDWKLPSFPTAHFLQITRGKEGYLFPDTYFFLPNAVPEDIAAVMEENFTKKLEPFRERIAASDHTLEEIIIMASIIEKEAVKSDDMRLISGILWKRIEIGMPLQVDAPFVYAIGKSSFDLTHADLAEDQPYNTYLHAGLPASAIANPGLEAINAALDPQESKYLFYLSDHRGKMHYAATFEEHLRNKRLYLN